MTGAELRRLRREAGMSQPELAEEIGVAVFTLSEWERGRQSISARRAREIRDALQGVR